MNTKLHNFYVCVAQSHACSVSVSPYGPRLANSVSFLVVLLISFLLLPQILEGHFFFKRLIFIYSSQPVIKGPIGVPKEFSKMV